MGFADEYKLKRSVLPGNPFFQMSTMEVRLFKNLPIGATFQIPGKPAELIKVTRTGYRNLKGRHPKVPHTMEENTPVFV